MSQELIHVNVRKTPVRILLIVLLILGGLWSYFVIRWYLGNTLAEYFTENGSGLNAASMATSLAPDDPLTHWRMAEVSERALPLDQQAKVIAEYEQAVKLSPYDYRLWMFLGTALGQAGESAKAEIALKRAVELAPAYAYPRWYLGNFLLRNGRYDEAFAELRIAGEANPELLPQQFSLIWEVYKGDNEAIKNAVGQSSQARARFALYLVERNEIDGGLRVWNSMSGQEKSTNKDSGAAIITALNKSLRYHDALKVWNEMSTEIYRADMGRVFDGGFEEPVAYGADTIFGWQIKGAPGLDLRIDPSKSHSGSRSLRLLFEVSSNLPIISVSQLVPVAPQTEYELEFYVSTEKLVSGSTPQVQILNAADEKELVPSETAPNGSSKWNRISLSFKTGENMEAIILRIVRVSCSTEETPMCPIYGSIWYDDFTFKRRN
jgi:tetratricopeptide (TPR) repeat protein